MHHLTEGKVIDKSKIKEVLGNDFYNDLFEITNDIKLDGRIFGYFERCFLANQVLGKWKFF